MLQHSRLKCHSQRRKGRQIAKDARRQIAQSISVKRPGRRCNQTAMAESAKYNGVQCSHGAALVFKSGQTLKHLCTYDVSFVESSSHEDHRVTYRCVISRKGTTRMFSVRKSKNSRPFMEIDPVIFALVLCELFQSRCLCRLEV